MTTIPEITTLGWAALLFCAMTYGMAKTGISNLGMATIPITVLFFGGKLSSGIVLPMLLMADIMAVMYYNKHANWKILFRILPWALLGVVLATILGTWVDDEAFIKIMAVILTGSTLLMVWREYRGFKYIPTHWSFVIVMGVMAGFTSMIGNMAGVVTSLFFLTIQLHKTSFIGTGAWFYFVVNCSKMPFHIFFWKTINFSTILIDLYCLPAIVAGAALGIFLIKRVSNDFFRKMTIGLCLLAALLLLIL